MKNINIFFETIFLTFFYSWKAPFWPWTFWSIFSFIFLIILIFHFNISNISLILITLFITIISIPIINNYEKRVKKHDNSSIVIDEFAWVFITSIIILFFTNNIYILILWLIFFRIFDIAKPWIIWKIDKNVKWWLWVMLDDIIAWILAWICSLIIYFVVLNLWIL